MEIAILVFFIAIFGGILFLLALAWFIFRRIRRSRAANRNFSSRGSNYAGIDDSAHHNLTDDDDSAAIYAGSSLFANQEPEKSGLTETAQDSPNQSGSAYSHESHGASAAPIDSSSYTESSYSSYDSGSSGVSWGSSDSGSSYDAGSSSSDSSSSSSDSGSSSSSSD
jgi:hypothetical protein